VGGIDILQLSDLHLVADEAGLVRGIRGCDSFARVLALAEGDGAHTDLVLVTGDVSNDGSPESYRHFQALMAGVGAPVYVIPGNHDLPDVLREHAVGGPVRPERACSVGGWRLVLLDSVLVGEVKGRLGAQELARLDRELQDSVDPHALVVLHHNPCGIGSRWFEDLGIDDREAFWAVLDRHPRVRGVLFAHIHQDFDAQRGSVRLLGTPSTSAQFAPGTDTLVIDDRPPGYRRLRLHTGGQITTGIARLPAPPT